MIFSLDPIDNPSFLVDRKEQGEFIILKNGFNVRNEKGDAIGIAGLMMDISAAEDIEVELKQYRNERRWLTCNRPN